MAYMSVSDFIKMENRAQIKSIRVDISSENRGDDMSKDSVPVSVSIKDSVLILTTSADTIRLPENCANMFKDCVNLEFVDWRHFDLSNVEIIDGIFLNCRSLRYVDFDCSDTVKVRSFNDMFSGCTNLQVVDMSSLSLKYIDFEKFEFRRYTDFTGCKSLNLLITPLEMCQKDVYRKLLKLYYIPYEKMCFSIRDGGVWKKDDKGDQYVDWMDMPAKSTLLFVKAPWNKDKAILSSKYRGLAGVEYPYIIDSIVIKTKTDSKDKTHNMSSGDVPIYANRDHTTLIMTTTADVIYLPENCSYMFAGLEDVKFLDLNHFNTDYVTDMSFMFCGVGVELLELSSFNTSNVTDMCGMFKTYDEGHHPLKYINCSSFNTSKVTDMSYMFAFNMNLTSLDLSNFNTSNVANMRGMFLWCSHLENLNISSFNTENVTDMDRMFGCCYDLKSLDLSHFSYKSIIQGNRKSNTNEERLFWTVPIF